MSFKNYLKFYFKKMPILTIILTAIVTKGGIIGAAFSSILGFFLVIVFYMPVANTILSIFCYPVYAMFNKNSNIDTSKDNGFKYVLALSIIWFYSFLVGSFILGMLGVLAPDSTQELLNETNNIKESFTSIMGNNPLEILFLLSFAIMFIYKGIPKLLTVFTDKNFLLIFLMSVIVSSNIIIAGMGFIIFFFVVSVTALLLEYFYKKEKCSEILLKYIPKKYFIYFSISFIIPFIILSLEYISYLLPDLNINVNMINRYFVHLPNIVFIILMILVIKNDLPKDKDKKETIDTVA